MKSIDVADKIKLYGESFEMLVFNLVSKYNALCIPHFKCYSHRLKRNTEIDLLVVTPYRIVCIESKKVLTSLKGELGDETWLFNSCNHRMRRENPVMQNYNHIRCIRNNLAKLKLGRVEIDNIICVPNRCRRKTSCKEVLVLQELDNLFKLDELNSKPKLHHELWYKIFKEIHRRAIIRQSRGK